MTSTIVFSVAVAALIGALVGLQAWRRADLRHADRAWRRLAATGRTPAARFDTALVAGLPEPARRYLSFAIAPGTPLRTVAEIRMDGEIGLGNRDDPRYAPMRAVQILTLRHGLVWKLAAGRGALRMAGSDGYVDGTSWVRIWLLNVLPIVRAGGTPDHARAAFGRVVAEAAFWTPAALLASDVTWEAAGGDVARAIVNRHGLRQTVDIAVAADGRPTRVALPRWSDANAERRYRLQPFGGYLSEHRRFDGYTLPTRVEGGYFVGTTDYFPFYKARVHELRFVDPEGSS